MSRDQAPRTTRLSQLPNPAVTALRSARDLVALRRTARTSVDADPLICSDDLDLTVLLAPGSSPDWFAASRELLELGIPEGAGGVNLGDRRALYSIARSTQATRILEVGTHIGVSTLAFAAALRDGAGAEMADRDVVTVDIVDVNARADAPWQAAGSPASPHDLLAELGLEQHVEFVTQPSLEFLAEDQAPFDVIFLDGSHRAHVLYQEIPAALHALREEGLIILHDYFPGGRPIWKETPAIPGPYLAVRRLQREGANLRVHPMGPLPWETKLGGRDSSLAIVSRV